MLKQPGQSLQFLVIGLVQIIAGFVIAGVGPYTVGQSPSRSAVGIFIYVNGMFAVITSSLKPLSLPFKPLLHRLRAKYFIPNYEWCCSSCEQCW